MLIRLTSAALLPPDGSEPWRTRRLAAMARPPAWVMQITSGRAAHAFAVGDEVALMDAAIAERANPLFLQGRGAWDRYAAALDARLGDLVDLRELDPGTWHWLRNEPIRRPDGYLGPSRPGSTVGGPIPDLALVVCTCRPHEGCHLRILAPHLRRAGWDVDLYGARLA